MFQPPRSWRRCNPPLDVALGRRSRCPTETAEQRIMALSQRQPRRYGASCTVP
jgi:hypothetical protein